MFIYTQELIKYHLRRVLIVVALIILAFIGVCTFFYMQAEKTPNVVNTTTKEVSAETHKNAQALFNSKAYKGAQATAHQTEYVADSFVKSQMGGKDTAKAADKIVNKDIRNVEGLKKGQSIFDNAQGQNVVQQGINSQQPKQTWAQKQEQETGSKYIFN